MRTIERTSAFKRDYKRVKSMPRHKNIDTLLEEILRSLALEPLPGGKAFRSCFVVWDRFHTVRFPAQ